MTAKDREVVKNNIKIAREALEFASDIACYAGEVDIEELLSKSAKQLSEAEKDLKKE